MSEVNLSEQEIVSLDEAVEEKKSAPEVVELEWPEIQDIVLGQARMFKLDQELATLLVSTEKRKFEIIENLNQLRGLIYNKASTLKDSKGISENLTYELKLPTEAGEKGYLVKNTSE
jgi:hypothetical protein|tara:strand:+ start:1670 stop:2020 length:351 start_codon:yes stop_codon:yes gene_type:complete